MKKIILIMLSVFMISMPAACGTSSSPAVNQAEKDEGQNYYSSLKMIAGLEPGTAGSSMKTAAAAVNLLSNIYLLGIPESGYEDCVSILKNDVSKLTDDQQEKLAGQYDSVALFTEKKLADPDSLTEMLSDAGVGEEAETLRNAPDLSEYWKVFDKALREVLGDL